MEGAESVLADISAASAGAGDLGFSAFEADTGAGAGAGAGVGVGAFVGVAADLASEEEMMAGSTGAPGTVGWPVGGRFAGGVYLLGWPVARGA